MSSWTSAVFHDSDNAEVDLCADRARFVQQHDIMALIPNVVKMRILHPGDNAQIEGFRELFVVLNTNRDVHELRHLVVDYFKNSSVLQGHLKRPGAMPPFFFNGPTPTNHLKMLEERLKPVHTAAYNSYETSHRPSCFENTRVNLLGAITDWVNDEDGLWSIYALYGIAGIGKSTIAKTVAERAAGGGVLGASFFFSREEDSRKTARSFFPTLAYHLAQSRPEFGLRITEILEEDRDTAHQDLRKQFVSLIVKPFQGILWTGKPLLIVIDALDECKDEDAAFLLTLLSQHAPMLPQIKVLITARPEQHIRNTLSIYRDHEQFHLHDIEKSIVEADIRLYINFRLSKEEVQKALSSLGRLPWQPTEKQKEGLVRISGKLFIIASTAVSFILDPKQLAPDNQLARLLEGVSLTDFSGSRHITVMDRMYTQIIHTAQPNPVGDWIDRFQTFVGTIALLHDPLPCKALARLLKVDANDILGTLSNLHSLLAPRGKDQTFRMHHKSFPDCITDPNRCKLGPEFFMSPIAHHLRIAKHCLVVMDRDLEPNMCDLAAEEWYKDRAQLHSRIKHHVSPELAYSCIYWTSHLAAGVDNEVGPDAELRSLLVCFASKHVLTWLEVLSIIGFVDTAYSSLHIAREIIRLSCSFITREHRAANVGKWPTIGHTPQSSMHVALEIFSDACRLVQRSAEALLASPMHIYHSALPFLPRGTALSRAYRELHRNNVGAIFGLEEAWGHAIIILRGHSHRVDSVIFSPDGSRVASASIDDTVRLWDGRTGTRIATLEGHSGGVTCVTFSPDGSRLTSVSALDETAHLWDGRTGARIATITGHSGHVNSVAFSPDGSRFASVPYHGTVQLSDGRTGGHIASLGSSVMSVTFSPDGTILALVFEDGSIQLRETARGALVTTIEGHFNTFTSVTFSPDGSRLASASHDTTVQLWDGRTGNPIATLVGHPWRITLVNFSCDGSRLVSVSLYGPPRLWNGRSGARIASLEGHCRPVNLVTFSPDGSRLASASVDQSVRLWNGTTGACIAVFGGGHGDVRLVSFSPDGSRLVSASKLGIVQLWDGATGVYIAILQGHSHRVHSLIFSSDGSRLASASDFGPIRLWDGKTGTPLASLEGHSDQVASVLFSPDGSILASASSKDKTVWLWDGRIISDAATHEGHSSKITSVAFSPDGSRFVSASDRELQLWNAVSGAHVASLEDRYPVARKVSSQVTTITFSPDSSRLVVGYADNSVRQWNGEHYAGIFPKISSSDRSRYTSASPNGELWLRDGITDGYISILEGHPVTFSPDGSRLVSVSDVEVLLQSGRTNIHMATPDRHPSALISRPCYRRTHLWHGRTGVRVATMEGNFVTFSPDSLTLYSSSRHGMIMLWGGITGTPVATLEGHSDMITSITFSPDGSMFASTSFDWTARPWDSATGRHISALERIDPGASATFSTDGTIVVLSSPDRTLCLWDPRHDVQARRKGVVALSLSPTNRLYLLGETTEPTESSLTVINLAGEIVEDTPPFCWFPLDITPCCFAVSPSAPTLAVGCEGGRLLLLDVSRISS